MNLAEGELFAKSSNGIFLAYITQSFFQNRNVRCVPHHHHLLKIKQNKPNTHHPQKKQPNTKHLIPHLSLNTILQSKS